VRRWSGLVRRFLWRRHVPELRARLADDVRNVAGWSDLVTAEARRLGAEVPDGVAACTTVWSHWADRLTDWARGEGQ
jgi:hypothetical protein